MPHVKKISTVFFDFGDTLVEGQPSYLRRITELLGEFGYRRDYSEVVHAFTKADYLLYLDTRSGLLTSDGQYMMQFLNHFGHCLDVSIDWPNVLPQILKRFDERLYVRTLSDGALEALEGLREKGYQIGVISNNDGRCREKCESLGIAEHFKVIIDSSLEGVRKPAPRIFEIALERMRVAAQEAAHVGDMYGSDVLGARDVSITPVWYNPLRCEAFDSYHPDHEIVNLKQVLDIF